MCLLYMVVVDIIAVILLLGIIIMLVINKDVSKVKAIVQKQAEYLRGSASDNFFRKNHYSFFMTDEYLCVSMLIEEQWSGSCWSDDMDEPKYYEEKTSLVKKAIRVLLSAMLPRKNDVQIGSLVESVFEKMRRDMHTEYGYYGNYETTKRYTINISDVYDLLVEKLK